MSLPKPCNLQREIKNHVEVNDYDDNDFQQQSQQKYTVESSQQKYTVESASVGCSGKCVWRINCDSKEYDDSIVLNTYINMFKALATALRVT